MPLAQREPDAIDLWFAMQRRAWWKKWRWPIVGFAIIAVWHAFSFSFYSGIAWISALPPDFFPPGLISIETEESYLFWQRTHYHLHDSLIIPAVLIPMTLAGALSFPSELIAAVGFYRLIQRKKLLVRKTSWLMIAFLYFIPMLLIVIFSGYWSLEAFPYHLILISWLIIFFTISEFVVFVSTRQLENRIVGINVIGVVAFFALLRLSMVARVQSFLDSPIGIIDTNVIWIALVPLGITALVSLVALVFLVRANKAPVEYQADG